MPLCVSRAYASLSRMDVSRVCTPLACAYLSHMHASRHGAWMLSHPSPCTLGDSSRPGLHLPANTALQQQCEHRVALPLGPQQRDVIGVTCRVSILPMPSSDPLTDYDIGYRAALGTADGTEPEP